jgi:hypothetical protein
LASRRKLLTRWKADLTELVTAPLPVVAAVCGAITMAWIWHRWGVPARAGDLGESFGPMNAVLSFVALVLVAKTLSHQSEQLAQQNEQLRLQREELQRERAERLREERRADYEIYKSTLESALRDLSTGSGERGHNAADKFVKALADQMEERKLENRLQFQAAYSALQKKLDFLDIDLAEAVDNMFDFLDALKEVAPQVEFKLCESITRYALPPVCWELVALRGLCYESQLLRRAAAHGLVRPDMFRRYPVARQRLTEVLEGSLSPAATSAMDT